MAKKTKQQEFDEKYNLDDLDKRLLQLKINHPGISIRDLAAGANCVTNTVLVHTKKPSFIKAYEDLTATTETLLKKAAREAARRLMDHIKANDREVSLKAIRMALSPYINQHAVDLSVKPVREFKTTFQVDGSLLQQVIDAELEDRQEELDGTMESPASKAEDIPEPELPSVDQGMSLPGDDE